MKFHRGSRWLILFAAVVIIYLITVLVSKENKTENPPPALPAVVEKQVEIRIKEPDVRLAVVLSLSIQTAHIAEFYLLYESWRFLQTFSPLAEDVLVDLIVFCEQPSCSQLPPSCLHLSNNKNSLTDNRCFYEELDPKMVEEWRAYLYMTSIAFMLSKEYRDVIFKYQWILRVDQDAVLSPGLLFGLKRKHKTQLHEMQFGGIGHGTDFTHERLKQIAKKLGYHHSGIHGLCSTWLVNPQDSITLANLTTTIGKHFIQNEFGKNVSGIQDLPDIGEWPKWWRGVTSLYAAEIAINHLYNTKLGHQHESQSIDHSADSGDPIWKAWHIHCLHNPGKFAKFRHRDELREFLTKEKDKRVVLMSNVTYTQDVLKETFNEFQKILKDNNGEINDNFKGKIAVNDFVEALAWQKAHSAIGAINL